MIEVGKNYKVLHHDKYWFDLQVHSVDDEFVRGAIIKSEKWVIGSVVTVRLSFCNFRASLPVV